MCVCVCVCVVLCGSGRFGNIAYALWILNLSWDRVAFAYFEGVRTEFGCYWIFSSPNVYFNLRHIKLGDSESVHTNEI